MQKTDFMNAVSIFEYTVNMMCRFEYTVNRFYQCRKIDSIIMKFKHEKAFRFGI